MKIGIIGTAGRRDDGQRMSRYLWETMVTHAALALQQLVPEGDVIHLVSGGAAGADHLAVCLFLQKTADRLTLHLPAPFKNSKFIGSDRRMDPGRIANYYHVEFRKRCGPDGLRDIQRAIDAGAEITVSSGFHERNLLVGKVDVLMAYTFGTQSCLVTSRNPGWKNHELAGLKDGGTAHTWDNSTAHRKLHTNLWEWC